MHSSALRTVLAAGVASLVLLPLACRHDAEPGSDPAGPVLALLGAVPLDPVTGRAGEPSTVLVSGDRITGIEPARTATTPPGATTVDAAGLYLLPGLWDLHTHLALLDDHAPPLLVTQGVLGVRDLGAVPEEIEALRRRIESGVLLGPRVIRAGPTLNGAPNAPHHRVIETPEEARQAVKGLASAGFDLIKTHNATARDTFFALVAAAHDAGLPVAGHVPVTVTPIEACEAGLDSVEHIATLFEGTYLAGFDDQMAAFLAMPDWLAHEAPALADCFAAHGTLFDPTLRAYDLRAHWAAEHDDPAPEWRYLTAEQRRSWSEAQVSDVDRDEEVIRLRESLVDVGVDFVRLLAERGAPVGAGTDIAGPGLLPGYSLHDEVRLLGRALSPPRRCARSGPGAGRRPAAIRCRVGWWPARRRIWCSCAGTRSRTWRRSTRSTASCSGGSGWIEGSWIACWRGWHR
ncbi:MAG: hypothetical protein R2991_01980 [Thermoanaerobaculia bacterium]